MQISHRSGSLVALLLVVAVLLVWISRRVGDGTAPAAANGTLRGREPVSESEARLSGPDTTALEPATERAAVEVPAPGAVFLTCRRQADEVLAAGVFLYVDARRLTGPTGADGRLEFRREPGRASTVWGPGWAPVRIGPAAPIPAEVRLEPADASLAVEVANLGQAQIVGGELSSHRVPSSPGAPWEPELELASPVSLAAEDLVPGKIDVYVRTRAPSGEVRRLSQRGVVLQSGARTVVRLDAGVAPDPEPDS